MSLHGAFPDLLSPLLLSTVSACVYYAEIMNGDVSFKNNLLLCHVGTTIDWSYILSKSNQRVDIVPHSMTECKYSL